LRGCEHFPRESHANSGIDIPEGVEKKPHGTSVLLTIFCHPRRAKDAKGAKEYQRRRQG
jgi:hypothetical protein